MKYIISIIGILFVALVMLVIYDSYLDHRAAQVKQAQTSPSNTAKALLGALVSNDKYMLNAIVVPEQQDEVATWLATHEPFHCTKLDALIASFPDLKDANFSKPQIFIVDKQPAQDMNTVYINAIYSCLLDKSSLGGLNFQVYEIVLEKRENRWYVNSWHNVCEVKSTAGCM
jgi:hypothetical protein